MECWLNNKIPLSNRQLERGSAYQKACCRGRRPRRPACKCCKFAESHQKTQRFTAGASRTPPPTISNLDFFYKLGQGHAPPPTSLGQCPAKAEGMAARFPPKRFPRGEAVERSETEEECGQKSKITVFLQALSYVKHFAIPLPSYFIRPFVGRMK